ncbi:MAG TPA: hypothetical protein VEC06_19610 [Paucimonas sp.]|nr:hypothetical protein [Paucimonas sp.]
MLSLTTLFGPSLRIGVSRRGLALLRVGRRRAGSAAVLADIHWTDDAAPEQIAARLAAALAEARCGGMRARLLLADDLVRYFMVTPPANAGSLRDCRAAAEMRFQALYGEPIAGWRLEADWQARAPFLACAMPASLLNMLCSALSERRLAPVELVPQFIAGWNRWRRKLRGDAWFGVVHDHGMTVGAIHQGHLRAVRPLAIAAGDFDPARLHAMLMREALLLDIPAPARLQLVGSVPAGLTTPSSGALRCEWIGGTPPAGTAGIELARTGSPA